MKIYVASSWRNKYQQEVVAQLREMGHNVYDFKNPPNGSGFQWSEIDLDWQKWSAKEYIKALDSNIALKGYYSDIGAMEWADCCVLVLPCGRSAHLEAGWFAGRGKKLYILTRDGEEPELMALMATKIITNLEEIP